MKNWADFVCGLCSNFDMLFLGDMWDFKVWFSLFSSGKLVEKEETFVLLSRFERPVEMPAYLSFDHKAWSLTPRPEGLKASSSSPLETLISTVTFFWPMGRGALTSGQKFSPECLSSTRECGSF